MQPCASAFELDLGSWSYWIKFHSHQRSGFEPLIMMAKGPDWTQDFHVFALYHLDYHEIFPTNFRSSFAKADRQHFDLAKLLDPFEKLEREFNWEEVTPLRPPSAFSTSQTEETAKKASAVTMFLIWPFDVLPAI